MNIVKKKISDLTPANYNPRKDLKADDAEYQKIKNSISEFGYVDPVIYNKNTGNIVGGHQRVKVLSELGYDEIDVIEIDETPEREKVLNIALNKIEGEWDLPALKDLLEDLDTGNINMDLTGFDNWEIEQLMNQLHVDDIDGYGDLEGYEEPDKKLLCCPNCGHEGMASDFKKK